MTQLTAPTIPNHAYCLTAAAGTTVTATAKGQEHTLLTLEDEGQGYFTAISESVIISDKQALLTELPKSAPALGGGAGANSPTHTKELTSGSTTTLRNGGVYTVKQRELPSDGVRGVVDIYCEHYGADDRLPPATMTVNGTEIYVNHSTSETYDSVMSSSALQQICATRVADHHLVLSSNTYGPLTVAFEDAGYPVTITTVVEGHEETHAAGTYADLSGLSIGAAVTTAEIWIDCEDSPPDIAWPDKESGSSQTWDWLNNETAELTASARNRIVVRNEGDIILMHKAY